MGSIYAFSLFEVGTILSEAEETFGKGNETKTMERTAVLVVFQKKYASVKEAFDYFKLHGEL